MTWTYQLLPDIPPPAQHILDAIDLKNIPTEPSMGYSGLRILENWRGCNGPARKNMLRQPPKCYKIWVQENIGDGFLNTAVMYCDGATDITSTGAHTDKIRNYVLICNLTTGGPDAELCFWQEKQHSLIREEDVLARGRYNDLILIDSVRIPPMLWYIINSRILHSVENLESPRINLQVSYVDLPDRLQGLLQL